MHSKIFKRSSILNKRLFTLSFFMVLSMGCAKSGQIQALQAMINNQTSAVTNPGEPSIGSPSADSTPTTAVSPEYKMEPLAWEDASHPERTLWSEYLQKIILNEWNSLLPGSNDMTHFCPRYHTLENEERANVWAQIFVAISKYESAYNPTSRMQETTMGTDPVTQRAVYSEGLLQLSYQDTQWAPWCDFDWNKDKNLAGSDPRKTILDPYLNLDCGVGIMAKQIKNKGSIVVSSGVYWAVIKAGGRYQHISSIQSVVKGLSLCK